MPDNFAIAGGILLPKVGCCCTLYTLFGAHHQMSDKEWSAWMAAAQKGDGARYRHLLGEVRPWLKRYFSARLPPAMVDDAVQDTLVALHEKRNS